MSWIWTLFQSGYIWYSDQELCEAMTTWKILAFEEIYERYADKIYSYIFYMVKNKKEAEDIVSTSMLKLYEYLQKSWWINLKWLIYRIAHNEMINQFTSNRYVVWEDDHMSNVADTSESAHDELEKSYINNYLQWWIDLLEPKEQELLYLAYHEELSYESIAQIMSSNTNTIGVRLLRAKKQLKAKLSTHHLLSPHLFSYDQS